MSTRRSKTTRVVLSLLLLVELTGCTTWTRDDSILLQPVPERATVELNVGAMRAVAHGIRADSATVSYVLKFQAPDCDSCRKSIPRAAIDSIRVRTVSTSRTLILLASLAAFILFFAPIATSDVPYT